MKRVELVDKIAEEHALTRAAAGRILDTIMSTIVDAVTRGEQVQLVGFGTFKQVVRDARQGFNPALGKAIELPATRLPKFVPGTKFKEAVDHGDERKTHDW